LSGRKIIFAGLARDVAPFLEAVTRNIEGFAAQFSAWAVLVVENDSNDGSKHLLQVWMERARALGAVRARLIEMDGLALRHPVRTDRIAVARNRILQEIEQDKEIGQFDYLAVLDMDFPNSCPLPPEKFAEAVSTLKQEKLAAGVFPNSLPLYYDIWALREKDWCPADCWQQVTEAQSALSLEAATQKYVFDRQRFLDPAGEPIEVESAFGGMGVYRMAAVLGKRYRGLTADGRPVCEHVVFHESIRREGGKFFILPAFLNLTSLEHTNLSGSHAMMTLRAGANQVRILATKAIAAQRSQFPRFGEKFAQLAALFSRHGGDGILDLAPQGGANLVQARLHGFQGVYTCAEEDEMEFAILSANALMHGGLFAGHRLLHRHPGSAFAALEGTRACVRLCTGKDASFLLASKDHWRAHILWARIEGPDEASDWESALDGLAFDQMRVFNAPGAMIASGPVSAQKEKLVSLFRKLPRSGGGLDLAFFSESARGLFQELRT